MMKKIFASVLVATMTFTTVASQMCFAERSQPQTKQTKITRGSYRPKGSESSVTWSLDDAGTLTISGTGNMENYNRFARTPWHDKAEKIKSIIINDGVTSIGDNAFKYCNKLTSVTLPNSVTSIGDYAFEFCANLTSITIPEGVTSIGDYAFGLCVSLESINIPDSVTFIGENAFNFTDIVREEAFNVTEEKPTTKTEQSTKKEGCIKRAWRSYRDWIKSTPNWYLAFNIIQSAVGVLGSCIALSSAKSNVDKFHAKIKDCGTSLCVAFAKEGLKTAEIAVDTSNKFLFIFKNLLLASFSNAIHTTIFKAFF